MAGILMRAPIILDNRGDMSAYASIEDALAYAEPVDVDGGEYEAFDSEGRAIILGTGPGGRFGNRRTVVASIGDAPGHADELRGRVADYLGRVGIAASRDEDLGSLLARLLAEQRVAGRR